MSSMAGSKTLATPSPPDPDLSRSRLSPTNALLSVTPLLLPSPLL